FAVAVAGDRALELAHPASERAAEVGELLGSEHDERDHQDDDQLHGADSRQHFYSSRYDLTNGLTASSTACCSRGLSKPLSVGGCPFSRRIAAAWRASTWTMLPAAASTSVDSIMGAAPL